MKAVNLIAVILLIVGGLNWGLVGLFGFDLVATLFGSASLLSNVVYTLVGVAAVTLAVTLTVSPQRNAVVITNQ